MSTHLKEVRKQDMYAKMGKFSSSSFSTTWLKQRGQKKKTNPLSLQGNMILLQEEKCG